MSDHPRCDCEPDLGPHSYARVCDYCGTSFAGARCVHHPVQAPCPECDVLPVPQLVGVDGPSH